jgi:hypothetical protein
LADCPAIKEELPTGSCRGAGHYLAPFARTLLAIAYVRDKEKPNAPADAAGGVLRDRIYPDRINVISYSFKRLVTGASSFIRNSLVCNPAVTQRR